MFWGQPLVAFFSSSFGRSFHSGEFRLSLWHGSSYKTLRNSLLSVLDLKSCRVGLTVNWGYLSPVLGLEQLSNRPRIPLGLLIPTGCLWGWATKITLLDMWNDLVDLDMKMPLWMLFKLGGAGSQGVIVACGILQNWCTFSYCVSAELMITPKTPRKHHG